MRRQVAWNQVPIDSWSPNQVHKDQGSQVPNPCPSPPATNRGSVFKHDICRPLVGADQNILWFGEELAGEEGFEPSIS